MSRILVIDDDQALCRSVQLQLETHSHQVHVTHSGQAGLQACRALAPELVFLDLMLPDIGGLEVLDQLRERTPDLPIVLITGSQDMKAAIEAMRKGAFDYVRKPFDVGELLLAVEKSERFGALQRAARARDDRPYGSIEEAPPAGDILGRDRRIIEVIKQIGLLAGNRETVLIEGESGTGKELVARALHEAGAPGQPFVAINCSAIVETLPESELFGHERGAFTGASAKKIGKLEFAGEGTLFLDEIGDLPLELQGKLLRVLQEREFERVGGLESIRFGARVLAATHRDLEEEIAAGRFRQDLFFRLAVARIQVPPLRERGEDVLLLADYLLARWAQRMHRRMDGLTDDARALLRTYAWPGNVRELENVVARAITLTRGPLITALDLAPLIESHRRAPVVKDAAAAVKGAAPAVKDAAVAVKDTAPAVKDAAAADEQGRLSKGGLVPLAAVEREHIIHVFEAMQRNVTRSARILEISPTTLRKKLDEYGLRG